MILDFGQFGFIDLFNPAVSLSNGLKGIQIDPNYNFKSHLKKRKRINTMQTNHLLNHDSCHEDLKEMPFSNRLSNEKDDFVSSSALDKG